jgi:hypothetical protein
LDPLSNGTLGSMLSEQGDYTIPEDTSPHVMANALVHPTLAESTPAFGAEEGHVMLTFREFLIDVFAPPAGIMGPLLEPGIGRFNFTINPGDAETFPCLNRIAICF